MKLFRNIKIQNRLLMAFGVLISLMIFMSAFSAVQLFNVNKRYSDLITSTIGRQNNLSQVIADMDKMYYINLAKGYQVVVNPASDQVSVLQENHQTSMTLFMRHLSDYRSNLIADKNLTESEKQERLFILDETESLFKDEYKPKTEELDISLYGDKQEMYTVLGDTLEIGDRVLEKLDKLHGLLSTLAEETAAETTNHSINAIFLLMSIGILLIVLSVLVSLFMTQTIKEPILEMGKAMSEISKGNLIYPIRSDHKDELGSLANQIGDMVDNISEMNKMITIMEHLDSMVVVMDFDYNLIYVNKSLAEAYGIDIENYKGKKCYHTLKELNQPCSICQFSSLLPEKDSFPSRDYDYLYDESLGAWIGGRSAIIRWVDGSMVYFQSIKNETEKKKNQERLSEALEAAEAASVAKSTFLANMSHEIRTPMNAILGMSELLIQENLNERQLRQVEDIRISAVALLDIINDILDTSKLQAGKLSLIPVHYDFDAMIDNLGSIALYLTEEKSPSLSFKLMMEEQHLCLYGDNIRLRQVLLNLLGNAIKFTDKGYVQLAVTFTETTIQFAISDTGIGIPAESLPTLFDAFEQADVVRNRTIEGTGLGLTITKSLVELMGGHITVESVYGQGTTFRVEIPKVLGDPALIPRVDDNETILYAPGAKILVVDDNSTNLNVACGLLQICGIMAETASSGKEAIHLIQQNNYDIVFMDHRMPELSGVETTQAIRGLGISTPIIALTASAVTGAKEMMLEAGMNDYLSKPIIKTQLMYMLKKWIPSEKLLDPPSDRAVSGETEDETRKEFWEKIEQIQGLSVATGLERVDGQKKIYEKTLKLMIQEIEKSETNLSSFLSVDDLENFRIEVHGIKGALANIGAMDLSEKAFDLETASGNNDSDFCAKHLPAFLEELTAMHSKLKEAFSSNNQHNRIIHIPPELPPILARMIQAFTEVDLAAIDREYENLEHLHLGGALKEEIEQIRDAVMMMDYDMATEGMQKLMQ